MKPRYNIKPRFLYSKSKDKIFDTKTNTWTNDRKMAKRYLIKLIP